MNKEFKPVAKPYTNVYGLWNVTTEGDCEGRSTKNLGDFEGNIDEIALHLADKCYYSLRFTLISPPEFTTYKPTGDSVNVSLDIKSNTWNYTNDEMVREMSEIFKHRPVTIQPCTYYAAFTISIPESVKHAEKKKIKTAMSKLSAEEIELLGLSDLNQY